MFPEARLPRALAKHPHSQFATSTRSPGWSRLSSTCGRYYSDTATGLTDTLQLHSLTRVQRSSPPRRPCRQGIHTVGELRGNGVSRQLALLACERTDEHDRLGSSPQGRANDDGRPRLLVGEGAIRSRDERAREVNVIDAAHLLAQLLSLKSQIKRRERERANPRTRSSLGRRGCGSAAARGLTAFIAPRWLRTRTDDLLRAGVRLNVRVGGEERSTCPTPKTGMQ